MLPRIYLTLVLFLTANFAVANSFQDCLAYFPNQKPPIVPSSYANARALCFDSFAVLHSGVRKTPIFTVEKLNSARLADADETRTDRFYEEARLPSNERARLDDYRGSGYDRGHMAPGADMPNPSAMAQSFSLANMIPQAPQLNRGLWAKRVEKATRDYVNRVTGDVFVFTGPLYLSKSIVTIGPGQVHVPSHVFKLVYDPARNHAWVHIVENRNDAVLSGPMPYSKLAELTGINFLP